MNESWMPRTDAPEDFASLPVVAICPGCGCEISPQRLAEHGGCFRCGTLQGWSDTSDYE